jgi:hypothetical protein
MLHALPWEGLALIDVKSTEASTIQTTQPFSVVAIGKADMAATTRLVVVERRLCRNASHHRVQRVNRLGVPTPDRRAKLLIHLAVEGHFWAPIHSFGGGKTFSHGLGQKRS